MELTDEEKLEFIKNMVFEGYGSFTFNRFNRSWTFKTLNEEDRRACYATASSMSDDDGVIWHAYYLEILKKSLLAVKGVELNNAEVEELCSQLPAQVVVGLYDEYKKMQDIQLNVGNNEELLKKVVDDNLSHIKFKVMEAFHVLPTDERVKRMNDHQWIWCYYNLLNEEKKKRKARESYIDYLAFFINPDLAKKVRDEKQKDETNDNTPQVQHEHEETIGNEVIHYHEGIIDEDFDEKLKMLIKDNDKITYLPDSDKKGDTRESRDDFISRVQNMENENMRLQELEEQRKADAVQAGRNENDFDIIDVK